MSDCHCDESRRLKIELGEAKKALNKVTDELNRCEDPEITEEKDKELSTHQALLEKIKKITHMKKGAWE